MTKLSLSRSIAPTALAALFLAGCASQTPPVRQVEAPYSEAQQRAAQEASANEARSLELKRKIALGRITNETVHGRSLLRDSEGDTLGKQVTDMLSKQLSESGHYLVFERPDVGRLQEEARLTGQDLNLVGVDTLIMGSLTEFGRRTEGQRGFLSSTQRQVAHARVDLRLVDVRTGQVIQTASGTGEASIEAGSVAGFGSRAGYDSSLNDIAVQNALNDAINQLGRTILAKPWQADFLLAEDERIAYISGGPSQGVQRGMEFLVQTRGRTVQSSQTGFQVTLPGETIGRVRVLDTFGTTPTDEGARVEIIEGSITGRDIESLVIVADTATSATASR
ncbi:MAG: curli production assembly protein CsgG [Idiomarina sp.]|nr:curli production assembly protein CsgG [Idiomarina sp.]